MQNTKKTQIKDRRVVGRRITAMLENEWMLAMQEPKVVTSRDPWGLLSYTTTTTTPFSKRVNKTKKRISNLLLASAV
jgi:hypothetical protein